MSILQVGLYYATTKEKIGKTFFLYYLPGSSSFFFFLYPFNWNGIEIGLRRDGKGRAECHWSSIRN